MQPLVFSTKKRTNEAFKRRETTEGLISTFYEAYATT